MLAYWKLLKNQEFVQLNVLGQKAAREWLSPVSLKSQKNLYEIIFWNVRNPCTSNTKSECFRIFHKIQAPKGSLSIKLWRIRGEKIRENARINCVNFFTVYVGKLTDLFALAENIKQEISLFLSTSEHLSTSKSH